VLTPPRGAISSTYGYVAVKVVDSSGAVSPGRQVTITGPGGTDTDTTGTDGCAVFPEATPGTYTTSLNDSGYVDLFGVQNATKSATVAAGTLYQVPPFSYDRKARLDVTLTTEGGYALPTAYATTKPTIVLGNTGLQPLGVKSVVLTGASSGSIDGLYPFTDGYSTWVGSCTQSKPASTTATVIAPGANAPTSLRLAPVAVTMTTSAGLPVAGATVVAYPVAAAGCTGADLGLTLGSTDATGKLMTSLPAGSWTLKSTTTPHNVAVGAWPTTAALQPTSPPTAVPMQVTL
jgi:hypothetical protein